MAFGWLEIGGVWQTFQDFVVVAAVETTTLSAMDGASWDGAHKDSRDLWSIRA